MNKKKIFSIFYIFIIFNSYSSSQQCFDFIITKDMFNLNVIINNKSNIFYDEKYNLKLTAFTYDKLDEYEIQSMHTLIDYYIKAQEANEKKVNLFGLINFVEKNMKNLGFDVFSTKESLNYTLNEIKSEINNNPVISRSNKDMLIKRLNESELDIDYTKEKCNTLLDTIVSAGSVAFASIAVTALTSIFSIPALPASLLFSFFTVSSGGSFAFIYNRPLEDEIRKAKNEVFKRKNMFQMLYYQIQAVKWEGNNIILTAISSLDYCNQYQVKFDYDNKIKYSNFSLVVYNMINRTCKLKINECDNHHECKKNLMEYVKCQFKNRKGIKSRCPIFVGSDCSLEFIDTIFDEL